MPPQNSEHKTRHSNYIAASGDNPLFAPVDHGNDVSHTTSVFAEFTAPMLRDAGVFELRIDAKSSDDLWKPISPADTTRIQEWVHHELLTFGFLLELAFTEFSFAKDVTREFIPILEAFRRMMDGGAYLTIADGKPAIAVFDGGQRAILTAGPRVIDVLGGDPVERLHAILRDAVRMHRPHGEAEVAALLAWVDAAFVTHAIEMLKADSPVPGQIRWPSKAGRDVADIISAVLGRCTVEWSRDHPIFTLVEKPKRALRSKLMARALPRPATVAGGGGNSYRPHLGGCSLK